MSDELLVVDSLSKRFENGVLAVDDVSLSVRAGETLGVVGESGCGKSTTGKLILRLLVPDNGTVVFDGVDLAKASGAMLRSVRAKLQFVPQNPQTSLNPRLSVAASIVFNLRAHGYPRGELRRRALHLLDRVGIAATYGDKYPHELSGGQLQRVAIARALATDPKLIICDEAVSSLDKSVQAQVLNLLVELQQELGLAYVFISHDLSVVEHLADRVLVMYLGRVVESADAAELWRAAAHPYSQALLASAPGRDPAIASLLSGDLPSPASPPSGCTFRTRCPLAQPSCGEQRPALVEVSADHHAACLLAAGQLVLASAT